MADGAVGASLPSPRDSSTDTTTVAAFSALLGQILYGPGVGREGWHNPSFLVTSPIHITFLAVRIPGVSRFLGGWRGNTKTGQEQMHALKT